VHLFYDLLKIWELLTIDQLKIPRLSSRKEENSGLLFKMMKMIMKKMGGINIQRDSRLNESNIFLRRANTIDFHTLSYKNI